MHNWIPLCVCVFRVNAQTHTHTRPTLGRGLGASERALGNRSLARARLETQRVVASHSSQSNSHTTYDGCCDGEAPPAADMPTNGQIVVPRGGCGSCGAVCLRASTHRVTVFCLHHTGAPSHLFTYTAHLCVDGSTAGQVQGLW